MRFTLCSFHRLLNKTKKHAPQNKRYNNNKSASALEHSTIIMLICKSGHKVLSIIDKSEKKNLKKIVEETFLSNSIRFSLCNQLTIHNTVTIR